MLIRMAYSYYKRTYPDCKNMGDYDKQDKSITVDVPDEIAKRLRPRFYYERHWTLGKTEWWDVSYVNASSYDDARSKLLEQGITYRNLDDQATYCGWNGRR